MKILFLAFTSTLLISASAFAMPKWDGSYSCPKPDGTIAQIELASQGESLFITGLGEQNGQGIPCANSSQAASKDDASISVTTACDDSSLSYTIQVKQASSSTDATMIMKLSLVQPDKLAVSIKTLGTSKGAPANAEQTITCSKAAAASTAPSSPQQ